MKRNTKSRAKSILWNSLFVSLCLAGATLSIWLFVKSFTQALYKQNEQPIATITFKYKTAQRKFMDRMIWDRLKQESPVYDGDTIRTAPQSEATIWFSDGNVMDLYENTLAQVFIMDNGIQAELASGDITVDSSAAQSGMTLSSGNAAIHVDAGSTLSAARQGSVSAPESTSVSAVGSTVNTTPAENSLFKVQVLQGSASVVNNYNNSALEQGQTTDDSSIFSAGMTLSAGQAMSIGDSGGTAEQQATVTVLSPATNSRVLNHSDTSIPIVFSWQTENIQSGDYVMLETSPDKDFTTIVEQIYISKLSQATLEMPSGTWYWRVYPLEASNTSTSATASSATDGTQQAASSSVERIENGTSGKLQILAAPPPELIVPTQDYVVSYRSQNPAVRFIWGENDYASSYQFCVADNSEMTNPVIEQRTSKPSSIISTLGEGTWYWQVTPYYVVNNTGLASPSEVHSFQIVKRGELTSPQLIIPAADSAINTKSEKGNNFSWRNEIEASSYTFIVSANRDLSSPLIEVELTDNYYTVNAAEQNLTDGRWFWGVKQTDVEGNTSPVSQVRSFLAVAGELVQRTVFPPEDYQIAVGRSQDVRFTWKTNLPYAMRYQVSKDSSFETLVVDEIVNTTSVQGKSLDQGTWYWRIVADDEVMPLKTQPRRFSIVPPLGTTNPITPTNSSRVIIRPRTPYEFDWEPIEDVEYYTFNLYFTGKNQPDEEDKLIYERTFLETSSIIVDMENEEEGFYRWTVQGYADETEYTTRRVGGIGNFNFTMKKLRPVSLLSPDNATEIDGIEAILNPGTISWSTVDTVAESTLYLSTTPNPLETNAQVIMSVNNPQFVQKLKRLSAGTYYWTIKAKTMDELDITAEKPRSFTVLPIPPLPATTNGIPTNGEVFGVAYLRQTRQTLFSWEPVKNATVYTFTITDENGKTRVVSEQKETEYQLQDLALLDKGLFTWSVSAKRYLSDGTLLQTGETFQSTFIIDLPQIKKPTVNDTGLLYGK